MPHLVEVWEEWKDEGLVILALSDESKGEVSKFVEDNKVSYPVGSGSNNGGAYGVSGIPAAFLIDHRGEIVWQGHPAGAEWVAMLPDLLKAAEADRAEWDPGERAPELGRAVDAARAGELGKAWKEAQTLRIKAIENPSLLSAIEGFEKDFLARAATRTARKDEMLATGRYHEATLFLEQQMKVFSGAPPAEEWKLATLDWKKDKLAKANMDLDKKRLAAVEKAKEDREKGLKELRSLAKKAEGLAVAQAIEASYQKVAGV